MKHKILLLRKFPENDLNYLTSNLKQYYEFLIPKEFSDDELIKLSEKAEIIICNRISNKILEKAKKLKIIQVIGAGVDKINLDLLKNRNVYLCNSHSNSLYVAEHAVALLFALIKKISLHDRLMRKGIWYKPKEISDDNFYLSEILNGKSIGLLGYGHIGKKIISFLSGFSLNFNVFDINKISTRRKYLKINYYDYRTVLENSDIIFVTLPLTKDTNNLIQEKELKLITPNGYIINISRGPIINEKSLFYALKNNYIAGAAIDAWYDDIYKNDGKKYPSKKYPFHKLDNIILSPYRATYTLEKGSHLRDVVKNLKLFAIKRKLINIVDFDKGF